MSYPTPAALEREQHRDIGTAHGNHLASEIGLAWQPGWNLFVDVEPWWQLHTYIPAPRVPRAL